MGNSQIQLGNWSVNVTNYDHYKKKINVFIDDSNDILKFDAVFSTHDNQEAMIGLTKFSDDGSKYFYNHKHYSYELSGSMFLKEKLHDLKPGLGSMDWGRGIWPYKSYWIWGSGNGYIGKTSYAINLGYNMAVPDASHSEDCVIKNNRLIKLASMICEFDENDLMEPWIFKTPLKVPTEAYAVGNLTFIPEYIFNKHTNYVLVQSRLD
jgi:hypothetical protein